MTRICLKSHPVAGSLFRSVVMPDGEPYCIVDLDTPITVTTRYVIIPEFDIQRVQPGKRARDAAAVLIQQPDALRKLSEALGREIQAEIPAVAAGLVEYVCLSQGAEPIPGDQDL